MAGIVLPDWNKKQPIGPSTPEYGSPGTFGAAVNTNANDYDTIMQGYKNLGNNPISPSLSRYSPSSDVTSSLSNLKDLSQTGGYSQGDIADIRARNISPIRSIYASANRNVNRQKSLQGGYSPGSGVLQGRMAREMSDKIGDINSASNANIAENVARNKLSIAPTYASAAGMENTARTESERHNSDVTNMINQFNAGLKENALGGMRGLYGTTPALTDMFGRQVASSKGLDQNQQQINNQKLKDILSQIFTAGGSV